MWHSFARPDLFVMLEYSESLDPVVAIFGDASLGEESLDLLTRFL